MSSSPARSLVALVGRGEAAGFAIALLALVLALRWGPLAGNWGEQLTPWPDAAEHVAGAQAIAESGNYFLQLGPWRVQPRYPPGFSLLLAPALRAGLPGDQAWRLGALFEWGIVLLLAVGTMALTRRFAPLADPGRRRRAGRWAGAGAAATWLLSPIAATQGSFVVSDQPTLLVVLLGGLAMARGAAGQTPAASLWWAASGLLIGLAAAMRVIEGVITLVALAPVVWVFARRAGGRRAAAALPSFVAAAAIPAALTCWLLARTGFAPTRWSTYAIWEPWSSYSFGRMFRWLHLTHGSLWVVDAEGVSRGLPNGRVVTQVLAGWPGLSEFHYVGFLWPALGAAAAVWGARALRRIEPGLGPWCLALGLYVVLHLATALFFVWPLPRLLLGVFLIQTLAFWAAVAAAFARGEKALRPIAFLAALAVLTSGVALLVGRAQGYAPFDEENQATRRAVADWLARQPDASPRDKVPFDSVRAHALGLLSADQLARVSVWGSLRESWHFGVLRRHGFVCRIPGYGWDLDPAIRPRGPGEGGAE